MKFLFPKMYVIRTCKKNSENYQQNTSSDSSVSRALDSKQEGSGSRLALQKISGDTIAEETSCPWRIKFMMSCVRTTLRGKSQTFDNSHLRSSNSMLNQPINQTIKHDFCRHRKLRITKEGYQTQRVR